MIFQYAQSTDPEVVEAIQHNRDMHTQFREAAAAFAAKYGDRETPAFYGVSNHNLGFSVSAIASNQKPTEGQWTKGYKGWKPFKTNPIYLEMMDIGKSLTTKAVPGVPEVMETKADSPGVSRWLTPNQFVWEGVAYMGLSMIPDRYPETSLGEQWEEILPSKYQAAWDAYAASFKS